MKKNRFIWVLLLAAFVSCNPKGKTPGTVLVTPAVDTSLIIDTTIFEPTAPPISSNARAKVDKEKKEKVSCTFGKKQFNKRKRPIAEAPGGVKGKKPKPTQPPPPPPPDQPPTTGSGGTIYLDFYGGEIAGTMWNTSGTFHVNDAGFSQPEIDYVTSATAAHFAGYNVVVTTDETVFNATPIGKRVRVVITESWEWYGQAGGVAYIGSYFWTDNSPAFVFSLLLNYNTHHVAEAASHEAGHTLGLRHQCDCSGGVITNQYSNGKTMGNSYSVLMGAWVTGPSSLSCAIQNDDEKLTAAVGLRENIVMRGFKIVGGGYSETDTTGITTK